MKNIPYEIFYLVDSNHNGSVVSVLNDKIVKCNEHNIDPKSYRSYSDVIVDKKLYEKIYNVTLYVIKYSYAGVYVEHLGGFV